MKRYIIGIVIFFISVAVVDYAVGAVCDYLNSHVKGGNARSHYEVYREVKADVIILGSSRADHHYVPSIIEDSLRLSCYNCGYDALGILSMYPRFVSVMKRCTPKLVIYDVLPNNDVYGNAVDHLKYLGDAKRYCDDEDIMNFIADVEPVERYKLKSKMYRYNTNIFQLLKDYVHSSEKIDRGYRPLDKTMDYNTAPYKPQNVGAEPDSVKLKYMKQLIKLSKEKGFKLVFTASPWYKANERTEFREIVKLSEAYHVPFICHYDDPVFCSDKSWFADTTHLNDTGAKEYTKQICHELLQLFGSEF